MIQIPLPGYLAPSQEQGGTALLIQPDPHTAILGRDGHGLEVAVDTSAACVLVRHMIDGECYVVDTLDEQGALALVSAVLNKLYFLKYIERSPKAGNVESKGRLSLEDPWKGDTK